VASGVPLRAPGAAWLGVALLMGLGSLLAWTVPAPLIDWQPDRAASEPWRAWTAAGVHWSPMHLQANLLGLAAVAAFGWIGRVPTWAACGWLLAWPCTQFGLLLQPALLHFGGLSGVLHAGVVLTAVFVVADESGRRRAIAVGVLMGLVLKLLLERPWAAPLRLGGGWDIAVAPLAHATGAVSGLVLGLAALLLRLWVDRWRSESGATVPG
jgi:rhomboid family GlyGly-CTERM serine protease